MRDRTGRMIGQGRSPLYELGDFEYLVPLAPEPSGANANQKRGAEMAKSHRGKGIRKEPNRGRGTCPICKSTGIKLLYERKLDDETTTKVCKRCAAKAAA